MSRSPRRGRQDQASAAPPPPAAHRRLPTKARTRSRSTHLGPPDRDPARYEGWMRREPRLRDQTQEDYVSDREAAWEAAVIATDARHPGAKPPAGRNYFPGYNTLSGRPGRGFFAHLHRLRRRSRPRQEQQQDDQQRPRRARSSPITPHILSTVLHASHTRAYRLSTKWANPNFRPGYGPLLPPTDRNGRSVVAL